ncbi:MAG: NADH-quinone oxidoreductase subunit NuoB [Deltaproteobacteria bacterium]|nr:NADH-quinone oxidoreductase subunit NuoB [Deltaproteobacteria bacterium]
MFRIFNRIRRTGQLTEPLPAAEQPAAEPGARCQQEIARKFSHSLAIRMVDAGSCNGCELEMHAVNNSFYDIERFGIHFVASPRHADLLLVTGVVSRHMEEALQRTYAAIPNPKLVIAMGDCAGCGGEFGVSYASCGAVANVIPVDAVISGCPPTPEQLLRGILELLQRS